LGMQPHRLMGSNPWAFCFSSSGEKPGPPNFFFA
jgi:hypothetical protein